MNFKSLLGSITCTLSMALFVGQAHAVLVSQAVGAYSIVVDEATGAVSLCSASTASCPKLAYLATALLPGNVLISVPTNNSLRFHVMNRSSRTGFSCTFAGSCTAVTFY